MVLSKGVVVVVGGGKTMEGIDGGPDSCSLPHHHHWWIGCVGAIDCLCWRYDGCGRDRR